MQHFLDIAELSPEEIQAFVERACFFKSHREFPAFPQEGLVALFYENSTRTRISFERAAQMLSIPTVFFATEQSSETKGETILDSIRTLAAMGISLFAIRHPQEGMPKALAEALSQEPKIHIINAGDGMHAHPSQALLDLMTILEAKTALPELKIAILGDLRHSRVANSLQALFAMLSVGELALIAPEAWKPKNASFGKFTSSLQEGLNNADVIICLRVQKERFTQGEGLDLQAYHQQFALTKEALRFAKKDAMVMHPGPMNRGIEIDSEVADGAQSYILRQVHNGLYMRMAIIDALLASSK